MAAFNQYKGVHSCTRSIEPAAGVPESATSPVIKEQSGATQQQAFQPTSIPHYAFVKFSSYRVSLKTFYVIGISSQVVRDWDRNQVVHTCEWHPASSNGSELQTNPTPILANASMLYVSFDEGGMTYVPAIVNCTFDDEVGADGNGGSLVIRVSLTYHRWERNVPATVHVEHTGDIDFFLRPPKEKPHKYVFCGPPMYGHVNTDWIKAWLVYHNYMWNGDALFFFYNEGGLWDVERHYFKEFEDAGLLDITDLTSPHIQSQYPSHYFHQILYMNDCLQRAQFLADFVFFFDFDEFLQIRPPLTLDGLLQAHTDLPWLTFGNIPADFSHCTAPAPQQQYPIERMLWHDNRPECNDGDQDPWFCVADRGRRKWVANTRLTILGGVHRSALPMEGGRHVNASEGRVIHFHGVLNTDSKLCSFLEEESSLGHMERDEWIKVEMAKAKLFPIRRKVSLAES